MRDVGVDAVVDLEGVGRCLLEALYLEAESSGMYLRNERGG